jgi:hypothetical protein
MFVYLAGPNFVWDYFSLVILCYSFTHRGREQLVCVISKTTLE